MSYWNCLDATFCPKCGAKQPEMEVKEVEIVDGDAKSDEDSNNVENPKQEEQENNVKDDTSAENTVEKVTEVMSVETQENAKESENQEQ